MSEPDPMEDVYEKYLAAELSPEPDQEAEIMAQKSEKPCRGAGRRRWTGPAAIGANTSAWPAVTPGRSGARIQGSERGRATLPIFLSKFKALFINCDSALGPHSGFGAIG